MKTRYGGSKLIAPEGAMEFNISHLAVLRASAEGKKHFGEYFGSWGALTHWIRDTQAWGLIKEDGTPTRKGFDLALHLKLDVQTKGRAYLWEGRDALIQAAKLFLLNYTGT